MDVLQKENPGAGTGSPVAPPVANQPPGNPPLNPPAVPVAPQPGQPFGGKKGGRARRDGLPPGSDAAKAADREKDNKRKKLEREAAAKLVEPSPLPPSAPGMPGALPASPGAGGGSVPGAKPPPIPWTAEDLSGLIDELIEAAESGRVENYLARCAEAGLAGKLVKEIEADARFPKAAKALLKRSIPRLCAKWLNRTGISAEWQDEVSVVTALVLIVVHNRKTSSKFDELLAELQAQRKKAEEAAKAQLEANA